MSAQSAEKNAPRQHPRGHQTAHSSEEMLFSSNESLSSPHRASENPQHSRRAKISLSLLSPLFPPEMRCTHEREREKNTFCAKNVHLQKSTFLKDHPNATSFNLPHSPRRRRKTIYRRVSLLAWRVQPYYYSFCYAFARNFSFFIMRGDERERMRL